MDNIADVRNKKSWKKHRMEVLLRMADDAEADTILGEIHKSQGSH
jgi:hypothetical protein